jgi:hypothetical protein
MPETLLSTSNVLLFGQKLTDLVIVEPVESPGTATLVVAATFHHEDTTGHKHVDRVMLSGGDLVLVKNQHNDVDNGVYQVGTAKAAWTKQAPTAAMIVSVEGGKKNAGTLWILTTPSPSPTTPLHFARYHGGGRERSRHGTNRQLAEQLEGACFARIYGFSYEGYYYDLARPTLFLVHGDGDEVTPGDAVNNATRAPREPSVSGILSADFQLANDIRVWSYDKADYTIRMDLETGMFEQVLLDFELGPDAAFASGANARVSGANARVSGANARVSGANARVAGANARVAGANARSRGD